MTRGEYRVEGIQDVRLDTYLAVHVGLMTRSQLKERTTLLKVNGKNVKPSQRVVEGDTIEIVYDTPPAPSYEPEDLPLDILFENDEVIVVNKARGVVVHPAAGNHTGTLVQGLMFHVRELKANFGEEQIRPGIVHRLDKDTSGIIISAKTPEALEYLSTQFRSKTVRKTYLAVVKGRPNPPAGRIEKNIVRNAGNRKKFTWSDSAGKTARTNYRVLRQYEEAAFVVLKPETGRTHQLRVHMMSLGTPILGDPLYSRKSVPGVEALMLHAYMLEIKLPGSDDISVFRAPLPEDFKETLRLLSKRDA